MNFYPTLRQLLAVVVAGFIAVPTSAQVSKPGNGIEVITESKLKSHIDYLASDALLGRKTPSPGLDSAAAYIAREFQKYGIKSFNGTYTHPLPLVMRSLGNDNHVSFLKQGEKISLKIKTGFVPFEITANGECSGNVVFAGYGITAPEYGYDDYTGIDAKGKIVLVLRHEPGEDDPESVFNGKYSTKYSSTEVKAKIAMEHGAVGLLVVTDPLNHPIINPRGYPWPSLFSFIEKDDLPIRLSDASQRIPVVHVGKEAVNLLFGSVDSLKHIQMTIDKDFKPVSVEFSSITASIKTSIEELPVKTSNVIGFIEGADPGLKKECLIIGAHYDHVGFRSGFAEGADSILNGADDNASGTAGLLAVAEAFSKMKVKPQRSVLFIAFSGEEKGLLGSEAYVRKPLFPLENTIAMLNMDMISRNHIDTLFLEGGRLSPDLTTIVNKENDNIGLKLQIDEERYVGGSDHATFYRKNTPFVFFFSGLHRDYHTVRDNPGAINAKKAARVSQLVFKTAWSVSNDNKRYELKLRN